MLRNRRLRVSELLFLADDRLVLDPAMGLVRLAVFFLVFPDLPIQFVGEAVNGRVHIRILCLDENILTAQMHVGFYRVPEFFDCHNHADVDYVVEMTFDAVDFGNDIVANSGGDLQMMAGNR